MNLLKNIKINQKLIIMSSLISLIVMLVTSSSISQVLVLSSQEDMKRQMDNLSKLIVNQTNGYIESTIHNYLKGNAQNNFDIVSYYYNMAQSGKLNEKDAKEQVTKLLLASKIGKTGYVYSLNSQGIITVHPNKELLNKDLTEYDFIKKQLEIKSGYLEYMWKNPGESAERPKALYMIYFEPWDWIISVSSYRDEFTGLIDLSALRKIALSAVIGKTGYPFLVDSQGILKIHPTLEGKNLTTDVTDAHGNLIFKKILESENGSFSYEFLENKKIRNKTLNFQKLKGINWIMGITTYEDEFYDAMKEVQLILIISTILGIIAFISSFYVIGRLISQPIKKVGEAFYDLALGNLSIGLKSESKDEIGEMNKNLNIFIKQLNSIVFKIKNGAQKISESMEEIKKSNDGLADKSIIQASSLEEISVTLKEISSTIAVNTENTIELSKFMEKTKNEANEIEHSSNNLKNTMNEIMSNSHQIERIIEFIDDIAFQTNLLALNAAVEAARAGGDSGKGFTVIAIEVRDLSKRSSELSKQIKEKIKESSLKIKEGNALVNSVSSELVTILSDIEKSNKSVQNIASGAEEQNSGIEQISLAIEQLEEIAQANAEIAEETSDMTGSVYAESKTFLDILMVFKQNS